MITQVNKQICASHSPRSPTVLEKRAINTECSCVKCLTVRGCAIKSTFLQCFCQLRLRSVGGFTVNLGNLAVFVATRDALGVLKLTKQSKPTEKDE